MSWSTPGSWTTRSVPRACSRRIAPGPLRYIILTQAHADHYGGVPTMREPETQVIAERRFVDTWHYFNELAPYLGRRSRKLWGSTIKRAANPPPPPEVVPHITVDRRHAFELGGRRFEVISTPGGETLDSLTVWMPQERVAFTGNLFGPGIPVHAQPVHRARRQAALRCSAISARSTRCASSAPSCSSPVTASRSAEPAKIRARSRQDACGSFLRERCRPSAA